MSNDIPLFLQYLAVIAPACSFIVATITVVVIWHGNTTSRMSDNAWEVYKQYTSEEIKQARITVRTLMEDPEWKKVTNYRSYRTYFQLDSSPERGVGNPQKQQELRKQDIEVHSLLAFYHQVGLLLEGKLLPEDLIMQLLGEGLEDRWQVLASIPQFYSKYAYRGMYKLHERHLRWKAHIPIGSLFFLRFPLGITCFTIAKVHRLWR